MAQSYFSPSHASQSLPDLSKAPSTPVNTTVDRVALADDVQSAYIDQKDRCVNIARILLMTLFLTLCLQPRQRD